MDEKIVFDMVDKISEDELIAIMDKTYLNMKIGNYSVDKNEKERIRARLWEKLNKDMEEKSLLEQYSVDIREYKASSLDYMELDSKKKSKNKTMVIKNSAIKRAIISAVAAMLIFIVSINISPSFANALVKIPVLNKWVQFVDFDKGFNNIVSSGNIQEENIKVENQGASFTVTSIAGDGLKLWIGYEFEGKGLIIGRIKFKSKVDNKELPWGTMLNAKKNYMEVINTGLNVKEFIMEVDVYKDDPMFSKNVAELDKKTLDYIVGSLEKSKVTTLSIPVSLSDRIYTSDLRTIDVKGKESKSNVGIFNIEKLELSKSRSRVYVKLISEDYELTSVVNPTLIDEHGKEYTSPTGLLFIGVNNTVCLELQGGINSTQGLIFRCDGFKYKNKTDKYITIDLEKKLVEPNSFGLDLVSIQESKITLKSPKSIVQFSFNAKNEEDRDISIKSMETSSSLEGDQVLEFKQLKDKKIILSIESIIDIEAKGFDIGF